MAAHRKPRQRPLTGPAARTAATLAIATAASATAFEGLGHAEPNLSPAQVKAKVDKLYQEAEVATEAYNGAKQKTRSTEKALSSLQDEAARKTGILNAARQQIGQSAAAQYRTGGIDPTVQVLLSSDPAQFLDRASLVDQVGARQSADLVDIQQQMGRIDQLRTTADSRLADLRTQQADLKKHKSDVQAKIRDAQSLLDRLSAPERTEYESGAAAPAEAASRSVTRSSAVAPNSRAAQAVSFAYAALGSPYVWGATGPDAFDCSGLTQAAYRSAGVSLPRTTYSQINAGQRVSQSELAPGDLIFFYSGISHVGLYVGGGQMIHAPHPGAPVRLAPIDQMPFAGAVRPG
ncbi:C40 family peptidase [Streptomyces beijiangensis]|uniref:C40 family peptidase n=1 Tax=Streptomyces beijiangensis TaxID=163361 RepID=A0A939FBA7_9ACTN|nr:C40 family peptidase [Streptomyces beijiangensis]MBO0515452.1 C40 family peptidase [Streptomyces beijiangensis]